MIVITENDLASMVSTGEVKPFSYTDLLAWMDKNCIGSIKYTGSIHNIGFAFEEDIDAMAMVEVFGQ